ncbi:MAG: phenylacetate-CoA oxygenase subunit PaaJ [Chitinophagaceae bacterium]|nr:phenylacetate-CoA oxygenase subunit PaaJ [Chitinophagaceae bacterium]MCW5906140.1 phenylacetate-CoA oxygenase subunit PaaJ [Chitinophagaceae bacterium]
MQNEYQHTTSFKVSPLEEFKEAIWKVIETVPDPEIPVITLKDLGVIRDIKVSDDNAIEVIITPTYIGCPAMDVMSMSIEQALTEQGYKNVKITKVLSPAWTTDWMSEEGKKKLKEYGIAPPNQKQIVCTPDLFQQEEVVQCPRCDSYHTKMISRFGSTPCKALYQCNTCHEPFEYFKCH